MDYGKRIIFDKATGKVLNGTFEEMSGNLQGGLRPTEIDYIDLTYGDTTLQDADQYHVDVITKQIVIDTQRQHALTYEELQQQLLFAQGVI